MAQPAPFTQYTESIQLSGEDVRVDVYVPGADPSEGVAIVAHGFTRSRARHRDLGQALAAAGFIAVVPDLPHVFDPWSNGDAIVELAHKLEAAEFGLPPVERHHLVLIGTSVGGLVTVLAAAKLPGLAGWIGLDPVDRTGTGVKAASKLTSPAVVLLAKASTCNLFGSGRSIARAVPGLLRSPTLVGASHCDFEGPTNKLCRVMCGDASEAMQAHVRDETVKAVTELVHAREMTPATKTADAAE